jgi:NADH/F420H2 dehydrogenase subunit C
LYPELRVIQEAFPQIVINTKIEFGELTVFIEKGGILPLCRFLHDDPGMRFDHITDIGSLDFPEDEERFEVFYQFYSIPKNHRIRVKARVSEEACEIDSVTSVWKGANFMEREVYDMMGIRFNNHPDLRRIMMPEDFDGYPLRKDFPTEGRGWRSTFEFLPNT